MKKENSLITGIWKFSDSVSKKELTEIAEEWAKEENYINLYIRKVSKDQHGIGFSYKRNEDSKESYDKFFNEITDMLKRRFGNDLVGWDLASNTITIKGF